MIFEGPIFPSNSRNYVTMKGKFLLLKILKHLFLDTGGFHSIPSHRTGKRLVHGERLRWLANFVLNCMYVQSNTRSINTYDEHLT